MKQPDAHARTSAPPWRARLRPLLVDAGVPWLTGRVLVLGALAAARFLASDGYLSAVAATRVHEGLLGWDGGWYEAIAAHGYAGPGHNALRFFPLVPAVTRAVADATGMGVGAALVVVANVSALGLCVALLGLVRYETGDQDLARRAVWWCCLAPPALALVMGYAEATFMVLVVATLWAARRRAWAWAGLWALLAGLTRPLGALLVLPVAVEALRGWRAAGRRGRLAALVCSLGGPFGGGLFLAWVGWRYGDALAPFRVQEAPNLRGPTVDPFVTFWHDAVWLAHDHVGTAWHLLSVIVAVALTVVVLRTWPVSYGVFSAAVVAVSVTGANLNSFERYAFSSVSLVLGAAVLARRPTVERAGLGLAAAGLFGLSLLAFCNAVVP